VIAIRCFYETASAGRNSVRLLATAPSVVVAARRRAAFQTLLGLAVLHEAEHEITGRVGAAACGTGLVMLARSKALIARSSPWRSSDGHAAMTPRRARVA
jgi:hypothetical protein